VRVHLSTAGKTLQLIYLSLPPLTTKLLRSGKNIDRSAGVGARCSRRLLHRACSGQAKRLCRHRPREGGPCALGSRRRRGRRVQLLREEGR
jgi:hypothetical protein